MTIAILLFVAVVNCQLSADELFYLNTKYRQSNNCSDVKYAVPDMRLGSYNYNQLKIDCDAMTIILENEDSSLFNMCTDDSKVLNDFRIRFHRSSSILFNKHTSIEVTQLRLFGIGLCSLDKFIHRVYPEYSFYRSQWALLINIEYEEKQKHVQLGLATDGEMIFLVVLLAKGNTVDSTLMMKHNVRIDLAFANENMFLFSCSHPFNVWRIDQGYVRRPTSSAIIDSFQLSKSSFRLFSNETFLIYRTQSSLLRRFRIAIDETSVSCQYEIDPIICTFPILPSSIDDTHRPMLHVFNNRDAVFNASLTLLPRTRLNHVPRTHSIVNISTFEVTLNEHICR
jgi:hypothetical protein